jgi:hypothetical protein
VGGDDEAGGVKIAVLRFAEAGNFPGDVFDCRKLGGRLGVGVGFAEDFSQRVEVFFCHLFSVVVLLVGRASCLSMMDTNPDRKALPGAVRRVSGSGWAELAAGY